MVAGTASAAAPGNGAVWTKTAATFTAQAKAHGYVADCTRWNRIVSMHCGLERKGEPAGMLIFSRGSDPCVYRLKLAVPGSLGRSADLNVCKPRWWTAKLPTP